MVDQARHHERRERQHLQRVPPHDLDMEQSALGAALLSAEAARRVAAMEPSDFYLPANGTVAYAIGRMIAAGLPVDPGTLAHHLREDGQLDAVSGPVRSANDGETRQAQGAAYLVGLQANTPAIGNAERYCAAVEQLARKRHILGLASEVVEGVYARTDIAGLAAQLQATIEAEVAGQTSSWEPVNLAMILAGEGEMVEPALLSRTDGQPLLYPGKVHSFIGEPESCKGWTALWACLEAVERGQHALYVDFEDDAVTAVERLLNMGATPEQLIDRFHYVQASEPADVGATAHLKSILTAWPIALCVIDSVGEGMSVSGLDEKDSSDFRRFKAALADPARRAGAAVVLIDHVVKDPEKRGGYAIGGQAKKAALDVVYELQVTEPFGRDRTGRAKVWCRKDRLGHVRGASLDGKLAAELAMDSRHGGTSVTIALSSPGSTPARQFRPVDRMAKVSQVLQQAGRPMPKTTIRLSVGGKHAITDIAIGLLAMEGYISHSTKGYLHIRPFEAHVEPEPEQGELAPQDDFHDDF